MKKFLFFIIALAALGGGAHYYFVLNAKPRVLALVHPVTGPAVQAIYATGTVEPTVMMPIAPRSTARLTELLADEGQKVEKGTVLAQLESSDVQKTLEELQARADFARKDYARKAELLKRGAVSKNAADQSKADLDAAVAAVARVKAELKFFQLTAPEDGVILRRDGEVGELIQVNQPVFWMSCCAPMRIEAEVDEEDIPLVQPGQEVLVRADAFPGKIMNGSVASITPKGDPVSRSYRVRVKLEEETPLMTGMTAETNIVVGKRDNALLVPAGAVRDETLWVFKDGKMEKRKVETGAKTTSAIEIRSGITGDDFVVMTYDSELAEGAPRETVLKTWKP